jgi:hypothetical protein
MVGQPFSGRRFVIYNEERGIYLGKEDGKHCWSKTQPGSKRFASTFVSQHEATQYITENFTRGGETAPDYELKEVAPTLVGGGASIEDCANALLPRWTPNAPKSDS